MEDEGKFLLWFTFWIFSPILLLIIGVAVAEYIKAENRQQIILECIKQAEIQNNPICSQYIKK